MRARGGPSRLQSLLEKELLWWRKRKMEKERIESQLFMTTRFLPKLELSVRRRGGVEEVPNTVILEENVKRGKVGEPPLVYIKSRESALPRYPVEQIRRNPSVLKLILRYMPFQYVENVSYRMLRQQLERKKQQIGMRPTISMVARMKRMMR